MNSALNMAPVFIGVIGILLLVLGAFALAMFIAEKQRGAKFVYAVEAVRRTWPKLSQEQQREKVEELLYPRGRNPKKR